MVQEGSNLKKVLREPVSCFIVYCDRRREYGLGGKQH